MAIKVGINGFGRIGRNILRAALGRPRHFDFVAVNDITDAATLAHLLKYDSVLGTLQARRQGPGRRHRGERPAGEGAVREGSGVAPLEGAGRRRGVRVHRPVHQARRRREAPGGGREEGDRHGPGEGARPHDRARRQRRAPTTRRPTTSSRTPPARPTAWRRSAKVMHESFGIPQGLDDDRALVHQRPEPAGPAAQGPAPRARGGAVDHPDDDRRGDCALGEVLPALKGRLDGIAMRVPTPNVSVVDLVGDRREEDERRGGERRVQDGGRRPAEGHPRSTVEEPLVSIDFRGNPHSSIFDAPFTKVIDGDFVKVLSWYDNEWGYSSRCVDLLKYIDKTGL